MNNSPVIDIISFTVIPSITTGVVVTNSPVIDIVSFTVILSITTAVVVYSRNRKYYSK
jgi:hypothetical protein